MLCTTHDRIGVPSAVDLGFQLCKYRGNNVGVIVAEKMASLARHIHGTLRFWRC
jgi:hypothetical protein